MDISLGFGRLGDYLGRALAGARATYAELSCMVSAAMVRLSGEWAKQNFDWLNPETLSYAQIQHPPTFILHGTYGDPSDWISFVKAIEKARLKWGLTPEELGPVYLLSFEGVEDGARVLQEKMAEVLAQYQALGQGTIQPRIIGHSLGGVVATREVFCRGMPFGVEVSDVWVCASRLGITGSAWRDGPAFLYSDIQSAIKEITTRWNSETTARFHALQASHDWLVPPEARLSWGTYQTIPNTSHLSIIHSKETHTILLESLRSA